MQIDPGLSALASHSTPNPRVSSTYPYTRCSMTFPPLPPRNSQPSMFPHIRSKRERYSCIADRSSNRASPRNSRPRQTPLYGSTAIVRSGSLNSWVTTVYIAKSCLGSRSGIAVYSARIRVEARNVLVTETQIILGLTSLQRGTTLLHPNRYSPAYVDNVISSVVLVAAALGPPPRWALR